MPDTKTYSVKHGGDLADLGVYLGPGLDLDEACARATEASRTMGGAPQVVDDDSEVVVGTASDGTFTFSDDWTPPDDGSDSSDGSSDGSSDASSGSGS